MKLVARPILKSALIARPRTHKDFQIFYQEKNSPLPQAHGTLNPHPGKQCRLAATPIPGSPLAAFTLVGSLRQPTIVVHHGPSTVSFICKPHLLDVSSRPMIRLTCIIYVIGFIEHNTIYHLNYYDLF